MLNHINKKSVKKFHFPVFFSSHYVKGIHHFHQRSGETSLLPLRMTQFVLPCFHSNKGHPKKILTTFRYTRSLGTFNRFWPNFAQIAENINCLYILYAVLLFGIFALFFCSNHWIYDCNWKNTLDYCTYLTCLHKFRFF